MWTNFFIFISKSLASLGEQRRPSAEQETAGLQADDLQMFDSTSIEGVFEGHRSPIKMSTLQMSFLVILLRNLFLHYESTAKHNGPKPVTTPPIHVLSAGGI